jgi:hypothetical protein
MIPQIDISELHEEIKDALVLAFPGVDVDYYDRPGEKVAAPAIRFGLTEIIAANPSDTGTEQLEVELRFAAECVATYKQGGKLAVRLLAANVGKFVQDNRFGLSISPGQFIGAAPDSFSEEYETWRAEWSHTAALGVSIWDAVGTEAEEVNIGQTPMTGTPFATDYVQL